jgi:excisionase family DNA binding protein
VKERSFYTTKEAAKYLGVNTSTVYRMEKRGLICSIKTPGEQRCFSKKNIEKYLKKGKNLKAHKNPIRYKKTDFIIKDREVSYSVENAKFSVSPQDELFFHSKSVWIYNADVLKINSIKEQNVVSVAVTKKENQYYI